MTMSGQSGGGSVGCFSGGLLLVPRAVRIGMFGRPLTGTAGRAPRGRRVGIGGVRRTGGDQDRLILVPSQVSGPIHCA